LPSTDGSCTRVKMAESHCSRGFFMKRIGDLKQQVRAGVKEPSMDGCLPQEREHVIPLTIFIKR